MSHPLLNAFWIMLWFFLWVLWLMLLFRIIGDLFRDQSLSGWKKALWTIFLIVVPFVGVLVYLIVRGNSMAEREMERAQQQQEAFDAYVKKTAASSSNGQVDELTRLADLKASGAITDQEFQQAKEKVLA